MPGTSASIRYWPASLVTTERTFSINDGLAASTVTPGSTAPDESRTTPAIDACVCPSAARGRSESTATTTTTTKAWRIASPFYLLYSLSGFLQFVECARLIDVSLDLLAPRRPGELRLAALDVHDVEPLEVILA